MKYECKCGYIFVDQTDDLPFKGYIYPDQSMESLYEAINNIFDVNRPMDILVRDRMREPITSPKGCRLIYQCPSCGRVLIEDDSGQFIFFTPDSQNSSKKLLEVNNNRNK